MADQEQQELFRRHVAGYLDGVRDEILEHAVGDFARPVTAAQVEAAADATYLKGASRIARRDGHWLLAWLLERHIV